MIKSYLITDPSFYSSEPSLFTTKLTDVLKNNNVDFICLRDKQTNDYKSLAKTFKKILTCKDIKVFLHTDYILAKELEVDGVHLPSNHFCDIRLAKELGLEVIVSTHSLKEALSAQNLGADYITYSPIFYTPNKGEPKGLEKLKEINDKINIKCFALGGILTKEQIKSCEEAGSFGFASIRYFFKG
jgi:thiamine-phosphate pyrophosphorylase